MATAKKKTEKKVRTGKACKPCKPTKKTAPTVNPALSQPAVPKLLLSFRCKKDHAVDMTVDALRVTFATRDAEDKVIGIFRTNQLCPICLVDTLNSFAETFPVIPTEGT